MSKNNMLITDPYEIGRRLHEARKKSDLSQEEAAWKAGISSRTYAGIERGEVNARLETFIKICTVFDILPDDVLVYSKPDETQDMDELFDKIKSLRSRDRNTALDLINVFLTFCSQKD